MNKRTFEVEIKASADTKEVLVNDLQDILDSVKKDVDEHYRGERSHGFEMIFDHPKKIGYERRTCSNCGEGLGFTENNPCNECEI